MITLVYDKDEMISALIKAGYEVRKEKEVQAVRTYHDQTQDVEHVVWNVYWKGERIELWDYFYGMKRVEAIFEQELRKRIIGLF